MKKCGRRKNEHRTERVYRKIKAKKNEFKVVLSTVYFARICFWTKRTDIEQEKREREGVGKKTWNFKNTKIRFYFYLATIAGSVLKFDIADSTIIEFCIHCH